MRGAGGESRHVFMIQSSSVLLVVEPSKIIFLIRNTIPNRRI